MSAAVLSNETLSTNDLLGGRGTARQVAERWAAPRTEEQKIDFSSDPQASVEDIEPNFYPPANMILRIRNMFLNPSNLEPNALKAQVNTMYHGLELYLDPHAFLVVARRSSGQKYVFFHPRSKAYHFARAILKKWNTTTRSAGLSQYITKMGVLAPKEIRDYVVRMLNTVCALLEKDKEICDALLAAYDDANQAVFCKEPQVYLPHKVITTFTFSFFTQVVLLCAMSLDELERVTKVARDPVDTNHAALASAFVAIVRLNRITLLDALALRSQDDTLVEKARNERAAALGLRISASPDDQPGTLDFARFLWYLETYGSLDFGEEIPPVSSMVTVPPHCIKAAKEYTLDSRSTEPKTGRRTRDGDSSGPAAPSAPAPSAQSGRNNKNKDRRRDNSAKTKDRKQRDSKNFPGDTRSAFNALLSAKPIEIHKWSQDLRELTFLACKRKKLLPGDTNNVLVPQPIIDHYLSAKEE